MSIAIISHPDCLLHEIGEAHPESPERVRAIDQALRLYPFKEPIQFYPAPTVTREALHRVHTVDYVDWIFSLVPSSGMIAIDADTWMNPYSLQAALYAAGAVIFAVDWVMEGTERRAFCNIRPPGHHAERAKAMGFCLFNNVAVGVAHALANYSLSRIAIIDFDVHHGNGTQEIFQNEARVLLCSSFQHPFYPGYAQEKDNAHILNLPLPEGSGGQFYRDQVKQQWLEKLKVFSPQLIFFSAGFDAHANDPLAGLSFTIEDYVWLTREIAAIAQQFAEGRMISVLEGGYNLHVLRECVPAHINAMQDTDIGR